MLRFTLLWRSGSSNLTNATATHQLTTKGTRRPREAIVKQREYRLRRQRQDRGRQIHSKEAAAAEALDTTTNARDVLIAQLADQIFSKGHKHVATATNISFVPEGNPAMPLVALAGRGLVGKTSLLRSLFRSPSEVSRSNRVLRRDAMNYFNVGDVFNIVDLPGFGGTSVAWSTLLQHAVLLRNFARVQPSLKMLYYCMDVHYKHGLYVQDIDMLRFLSKEVPNFTIVITKAEQINEQGRSQNHFRMEDIRKELLFNDIQHPVLITSAYRMGGIDTLRFDMAMNSLHALPTEHLTYTEARRLSQRLFSQAELGTVRPLMIPPTQADEEVAEWNKQVREEYQKWEEEEEEGEVAGGGEKDTAERSRSVLEKDFAAEAATAMQIPEAPEGDLTVAAAAAAARGDGDDGEGGAFTVDATAIEKEAEDLNRALALADDAEIESAVRAFGDDVEKQEAYKHLVKTTRNKELMKYVRETSPWRNPLVWPSNVVPTKHPKSNIMRCPEDPSNPYLTQAQFVAPRADFYFRKPNVGVRRAPKKGRYEADKVLSTLLKPYTIPYFPDIVDTNMNPLPWTFLGSREAFYEKSGGRLLGVRLTQQATEGSINPLVDNPAPQNAELTKELRLLETERYGSPIAMLTPPGMEAEEESETQATAVSNKAPLLSAAPQKH